MRIFAENSKIYIGCTKGFVYLYISGNVVLQTQTANSTLFFDILHSQIKPKSMRTLYLLIVILIFHVSCYAQVNLKWAKKFGGASNDYGYSIAVDASGNVYNAGFFGGVSDFDPGTGVFNLTSNGSWDIFITKQDSSGNLQWAKGIGASSYDQAYGIALDSSDNVYVTGWFTGTVDFNPSGTVSNLTSSGGFDGFILKLDASGNFVWAKSFGGIDNDVGYGVAVDGQNNVYATGYFSGTADFDPSSSSFNLTSLGYQDIFSLKLDQAGNLTWAKRFGSGFIDMGNAITVDENNAVLITGMFYNTVDFDPNGGVSNLTTNGGGDAFVCKLSNLGSLIWAKKIGGTNEEQAYSIVTDQSGNVYCTGWFYGTGNSDLDPGAGNSNVTSNGDKDIFICKLNSLGSFLWGRGFGSDSTDYGNSVIVDGAQNVYVSGQFFNTINFDANTLVSIGDIDAYTVKLDIGGNAIWTKQLGGASSDLAQSSAIDNNGNIYISGSFSGSADFDPELGTTNLISSGSTDIFTTKLKLPIILITPISAFSGSPLTITVGNTVSFTNQSQLATSYSWAFAGGTPSTFNGQTPPPIQYNTVGTYDVTLSATDGVITDVRTESSYIHVTANSVTGLSGDPDVDFGNVVAPGYADHVYFFYNNSPNPITISTIQFPINSGYGVQFVNGTTVLPYQNLPVLLQFFPQLQQTYSATATVISNASNNPITLHVTGVGTAQNISWIGFYNKPENNPEITQLEPLAENYITSNTQSTVKICADFSKATAVKFINNNGTIASSNIRFRMKSDPNGNNTDYTGWFITTDYSVVGNVVTARFTHPKYLNGNGLYRVDTIQVVNSANNAVIYEHPARIYRAPVVLVHGLWGNAYSMQEIQYQLITSGKYNSTMVKVIDYESTNSYDYNTNANVVKDGINNTLIGLRILKYSAGKVDIVAHSMGGILSRIYLQNPDCMGTPNNCYRGDIHKLITLNTPHSGTQVANFFLGNSNCAAIARLLLGQNGMNWSNGAVADLQCNSPAIAAMNSTPSLNRHIVPCRATATYTTPGPTTILTNENALTNAIGVCRAESGLQFNNTVFLFTPNDLIVPDNSQIGGLPDYSYIANTMHTESPNSSSVISDLQVSLEANAATSSLFDGNTGGFNPPVIAPTLKTDETNQDSDGSRSGNITITSPSFGFSTTSGSTIQVSVTAASAISRVITTIGNIQAGIYSIDTIANNFSFNYTVPTTVVGKISIVALGFDISGLVDFDTLEIQSVPSIAPDSIKFVEEFIAVPKSRTTGFRLMGYFNGIQNDITELSGSTFSIDSTPIATISKVSNVYGVDTGFTTLQGAFLGKSAYAYVKVYIGSDWVTSSINSPSTTNKSLTSFSIYPNPTTDIVNVLCNKNNFKGSYSVFDVTGKKVIGGSVNENFFSFDLEKCSSGLYFLHVTDTQGEKHFQGKIIKE